jgi:hypothetical protein
MAVVLGVLFMAFYMYGGSKIVDSMITNEPQAAAAPLPDNSSSITAHAGDAQASTGGLGHSSMTAAQPKDLLPQDHHSAWASLNPSALGQGNMVIPDMLEAGKHIGLDTVGQTMKNANQQLRSDPPIPKASGGCEPMWNKSTIEPANIQGSSFLEIGR